MESRQEDIASEQETRSGARTGLWQALAGSVLSCAWCNECILSSCEERRNSRVSPRAPTTQLLHAGISCDVHPDRKRDHPTANGREREEEAIRRCLCTPHGRGTHRLQRSCYQSRCTRELLCLISSRGRRGKTRRVE